MRSDAEGGDQHHACPVRRRQGAPGGNAELAREAARRHRIGDIGHQVEALLPGSGDARSHPHLIRGEGSPADRPALLAEMDLLRLTEEQVQVSDGHPGGVQEHGRKPEPSEGGEQGGPARGQGQAQDGGHRGQRAEEERRRREKPLDADADRRRDGIGTHLPGCVETEDGQEDVTAARQVERGGECHQGREEEGDQKTRPQDLAGADSRGDDRRRGEQGVCGQGGEGRREARADQEEQGGQQAGTRVNPLRHAGAPGDLLAEVRLGEHGGQSAQRPIEVAGARRAQPSGLHGLEELALACRDRAGGRQRLPFVSQRVRT